MINLLVLLKNKWKLILSGGLIILILILGGLAWYYKNQSDLNRKSLVIAEQELDKVVEAAKTYEQETNRSIEALTKDRNAAVKRERLISSKQKKALNEASSNDNIDPSWAYFYDELFSAEQAANDNKIIYPVPR